MTMGHSRSRVKPWPVDGGREGSGICVEVIKPEGTGRYRSISGLPVTTDDVVRVVTSSGAGHGDPKRRDRSAVAADIKAGLITPGRAAEIYGE